MKLDLRPLLLGERLLKFDYELQPDIDSEDTASFLYGVSFPSPMKVSGDITNTAGYMRMRLTASLDYSARCARCLSEVNGSFAFDLEKTVAPREVLSGLDEDRLDDYAIIDDGFLDIDSRITEQLEVEFPIRFLCKDDCKGLCSKCGKNLNDGDCGCDTKEIDPRMAPLQKLLEKMKNNK